MRLNAAAQVVDNSNASPVTATHNLYTPWSIMPDAAAIEQANSPSSPVWDNKAPARQHSRHSIPSSRKTSADKPLFITNTAPVTPSMDHQWPPMYRTSNSKPTDTKYNATKNTLNGRNTWPSQWKPLALPNHNPAAKLPIGADNPTRDDTQAHPRQSNAPAKTCRS